MILVLFEYIFLTLNKYIKHLELKSFGIEIDGNVIQMITYYCNGLEKLVISDGYFLKISDKHIQEFGLKFANSLKTLNIIKHYTINNKKFMILKNLFEFVPNFKTFHFNDLSQVQPKKSEKRVKIYNLKTNPLSSYILIIYDYI